MPWARPIPRTRSRRTGCSPQTRTSGHLETQLSEETLWPWQPEADYFCQWSQNRREIELSGRRVIMQCWRADERRAPSRAREVTQRQQDRAAGPGGGRRDDAAHVGPCQNQYGGRHITSTGTAISGNAIVLEVFQSLLLPPDSRGLWALLLKYGRVSWRISPSGGGNRARKG